MDPRGGAAYTGFGQGFRLPFRRNLMKATPLRRIALMGSAVLAYSGATKLARRVRHSRGDHRIYILTYHEVGEGPDEPEGTVSARPVVRETVCKTILNRGTLSDYSLNCYTGCTHRCVYCYARFMQRFHPHDEPWGDFVDVKVNAVETLTRQLRRAEQRRLISQASTFTRA